MLYDLLARLASVSKSRNDCFHGSIYQLLFYALSTGQY